MQIRHIVHVRSSFGGHLGCFHYLLWLVLPWRFVYKCLSPCFHFFQVYIPWSGMAGPCSVSVFNFLRNHQAIFHSGCVFCIPACDIWRFQVVHLLANTCFLLKKKKRSIYVLVMWDISMRCVFLFFVLALLQSLRGSSFSNQRSTLGPGSESSLRFLYFLKFIYLFLLRWVSVAAGGLFLAAASRGVLSSSGARASPFGDFLAVQRHL